MEVFLRYEIVISFVYCVFYQLFLIFYLNCDYIFLKFYYVMFMIFKYIILIKGEIRKFYYEIDFKGYIFFLVYSC